MKSKNSWPIKVGALFSKRSSTKHTQNLFQSFSPGPVKDSVDEEIKLILDPARQRFGSVVDLSVAHSVCTGSDINRFRTVLFNLNVAKEAEVSSKIQAAVDNVLRGAR